MLSNYYLQVLQFFVLNSLLGLSIYLPLSAGQLSLGSGGFAAIGAYTAALLSLRAGWSPFLTIPAAVVSATLAALMIGYPALRLRGVYLAIATLGFGEVVRVVANNLEFTGGALGLKNIPNLPRMAQKSLKAMLGEAPLDWSWAQTANLVVALSLLALLGLILLLIYLLRSSRHGRAFAALKADEVAAEASAVDPTRYKLLAFTLGAALAGLAGGLGAHLTYYVGPGDYAFGRTVEMLLFVILGGMQLPLGPVAGAGMVMVLLEGLRDLEVMGQKLADWRLVIYGLLMLLMMALRPQGLLAARRPRTAGPGGAAAGAGAGQGGEAA